MKILVIRFSALGDVAMLAPVVKQYALSNPNDEITVLSRPKCSALFDELASNVHFLGKDVKHDYKGVFGLFRLFLELHHTKFDYICDMHDVLRTKILRFYFRLFGYKIIKLDKHRDLRKLITAPEGEKKLMQLPTAFENYAEVLHNVSKDFKFQVPGHLMGLQNGSGVSKKSSISYRYIGIAPFSAHEGKVYPLDKIEEVMDILVEKGYTLYLFGGGKKENDIMQKWYDKFSKKHLKVSNMSLGVHLASETCHSLKDELKLMSILGVMLSMDSANMHLASLVGTRVVSIWGATHPCAGFLGWGQSSDDCIQVDLPCRPCSIYGNKPCLRGDMACMNSITPETIVERIME